jgi:hypothetical protein
VQTRDVLSGFSSVAALGHLNLSQLFPNSVEKSVVAVEQTFSVPQARFALKDEEGHIARHRRDLGRSNGLPAIVIVDVDSI